ncbi:MAG: lipid-binding SYLF domain-containing protein [Desulfobulbaceae bacterium]|uniref:Lipid-binding SYLF domain-containing protein n=1 Tax=Candidatus Desulfatifera sulfidica TaxID=2841691 RepID=A0A8J6N9S9_9BACT|nr:lipid-binding SYLF domain-containing protein [Candidatus Desulfatifera sulfidica]
MRKIVQITISLLIILTWTVSYSQAENYSSELIKVHEATVVLNEMSAIPEKSIPPTLLANSYGIIVIPGLIKAGFGIGGRYGTGLLITRDPKGGWYYPIMVTLTGGSIGWQIGVQSTDVILVFKNPRSIEAIQKGKFTLGADASIAAGPVGRHAEAATDITLKSEIYSYSRSRGLFAGFALEGAVLSIDHESTWNLYSLPVSEVLSRKNLANIPTQVHSFQQKISALTK